MTRSLYLRIVAVFEIIGFIAGLIVYGITTFPYLRYSGLYAIGIIVGFIAIIFFGPATFILLTSVANLLDNQEATVSAHYEKIQEELALRKEIKAGVLEPFGLYEGQRVVSLMPLKLPNGQTVPQGCQGIITGVSNDSKLVVSFSVPTSGNVLVKVSPSFISPR